MIRIIKKYLFARECPIADATATMHHFRNYQQLVAVEAYNLDHAVKRLCTKWPNSKSLDWHLLDQLEPEHFLGMLGTDLPLNIQDIRRQ